MAPQIILFQVTSGAKAMEPKESCSTVGYSWCQAWSAQASPGGFVGAVLSLSLPVPGWADLHGAERPPEGALTLCTCSGASRPCLAGGPVSA